MCLYPVTILNRALYSNKAVTPTTVQVPCNTCAACRDARKTSWEDRLCLEVAEWYRNGGIGLMLTFTYNNACLPRYARHGVDVPCFSPSDILAMLSRIKTKSKRAFGDDFYRYFVCSEFGKDTHRPHYHTIFLIRDPTKYVQFVEMCRQSWFWLFERDRKGHKKPSCSLGYMFPKRVHGRYVDDRGRNKDPRFRSQKAGAKYVCKYICKDLAYMQNPAVAELYKTDLEFRYYCPRSWKSNNIGFSAIERIVENGDDTEIAKLITNGVWSPLQQKYVPLWSSAVSRLMYNNVFNGRYSRKTGKKQYDRELSDFGRKWLWFHFKKRYEHTMTKMYERALLLCQNHELHERFDLPFVGLPVPIKFANNALWHCLLQTCTKAQLISKLVECDYDMSKFFNVDTWQSFYMLRHDSVTLSDCDIPFYSSDFDIEAFIAPYVRFEMVYAELCRYLEICNLQKYKQRGEAIQRAKVIQGAYGFPRALC